ncbi:MAG: response regulator transcription factor [Bacteroidetes bacterium]|jgi:two-component system alkaline phosphatase synthesis response regulator PhoP|nr:response regulator transcription factor [Bacteroidota bacterium]MCA6442921.1 response regulator transcription factor [Bacteroidota bacterium]
MPLKPLILLVEDEISLASTLALNLELEGFQIIQANTGNKAIDLFHQNKSKINLVFLDIMLPDVNGYTLCKLFKEIKPDLPIIFITARNQTIDKIEGLKLGADDYITKPFELEEVLLRTKNLLKRTQPSDSEIFKFGSNTINFDSFEVNTFNGETFKLTKREIGLLKILTNRVNKVLSRDEIIEELWHENENPSGRTIDNYIVNFRKMFEKNPKEPIYFLSIRGVGYKFEIPN